MEVDGDPPGASAYFQAAQTSTTCVPMKTAPVIQRMITKRASISLPIDEAEWRWLTFGSGPAGSHQSGSNGA